MARVNFVIPTGGEIALASSSAKTILQVVAATNQRAVIKGACFTFDGTSASGEPGLVQIIGQSTSGTFTQVTLVQENLLGAETVNSSGFRNATAEPSSSNTIREYLVHPQAGYERSWGPDEEIIVLGGRRVGVVCNFPAAVNVRGFLVCEE